MDVTNIEKVQSSMITLGSQIRDTKYAALALYAMMVYDYLLTLHDEIEYVWKRKFTIMTFLFVLTRYYSLLVLTLTIAAYFSPLFVDEVIIITVRCTRFIPFLPFAVGIPLTFFPAITMWFRVYALYERSKSVGFFLAMYLLAEFAVKLWISFTPGSHPLRVPPEVAHLDAFSICISIGADSRGLGFAQNALFQFMQTTYDTIVCLMILHATAKLTRTSRMRVPLGNTRQTLLNVLMSQGILYYAVTFSANFAWAMMIIFAPDGLKYIMAMPTLMLNCIAINRITLGLYAAGDALTASERPTARSTGQFSSAQESALWLSFSRSLRTTSDGSTGDDSHLELGEMSHRKMARSF